MLDRIRIKFSQQNFFTGLDDILPVCLSDADCFFLILISLPFT